MSLVDAQTHTHTYTHTRSSDEMGLVKGRERPRGLFHGNKTQRPLPRSRHGGGSADQEFSAFVDSRRPPCQVQSGYKKAHGPPRCGRRGACGYFRRSPAAQSFL